MMTASKTEDYQLLGEVLDQGLKELGYSREDLKMELFASDKQHVLDLYCSKGMRPSTCLWGVRRLLGNPDGGVCSAWWTEVLPPSPGTIWT